MLNMYNAGLWNVCVHTVHCPPVSRSCMHLSSKFSPDALIYFLNATLSRQL